MSDAPFSYAIRLLIAVWCGWALGTGKWLWAALAALSVVVGYVRVVVFKENRI